MTTTHDAPATVPTAVDATQGNALRAVDPATLGDNPNNARWPHRDRDSLARSISALGILNPPWSASSTTVGSSSQRASAASTRPSRRGSQLSPCSSAMTCPLSTSWPRCWWRTTTVTA